MKTTPTAKTLTAECAESAEFFVFSPRTLRSLRLNFRLRLEAALWDDRKIELGDDWRPEIEEAINRAAIAILLISANFLISNFSLDEEVPKFLERRTKDGLRVILLIVKPCAWKQVGWLSKIQGRSKDNRPLSSGNEHQIDTDLAALANEIAGIIKRAGVGGRRRSADCCPSNR